MHILFRLYAQCFIFAMIFYSENVRLSDALLVRSFLPAVLNLGLIFAVYCHTGAFSPATCFYKNNSTVRSSCREVLTLRSFC